MNNYIFITNNVWHLRIKENFSISEKKLEPKISTKKPFHVNGKLKSNDTWKNDLLENIDHRNYKNISNNTSNFEIKNMVKKILKFTREIEANREKIEKIRNIYNVDFEEIINKFGESELGLNNESDKKDLIKLIHGIVNLKKNYVPLKIEGKEMDSKFKIQNEGKYIYSWKTTNKK